MAIETQVTPVVIGASEVNKKTTFLAVFGSNLCTATRCFPRIETSHIYSIFLFSFLADGDLLPGEVAFSRLD